MNKYKLFWNAFAFSLFILSSFLLNQLASEPKSAQIITTASTHATKNQSLPFRWSGAVGSTVSRTFSFEFESQTSAPNDLSYIYIPYFEQGLHVYLNGTSLTQNKEFKSQRGILSAGTALILLPDGLLKNGKNLVELIISTGPSKFGSLSRIYVGSEAELLSYFRVRRLSEHEIRVIIFGIQAFLVICCIALVALHPLKTTFFWLGSTMALSCMHSLGVFGEVFPIILTFEPWLFFLAAIASLGFLGFSAHLAGTRIHKNMFFATMAIPSIGFFLAATNFVPLAETLLWLIYPVSVISLIASFFLLCRRFLQKPSADLAFLVSGVALMIGAVVHDQLLRLGYISDGVFLAQSARLLTLIGIGVFLMVHLASATRDLNHATQSLTDQLRQRENELAAVFGRERLAAEKAASQNERSRIMAELHDGVAGHLATIVALSDVESPNQQEIQIVARSALSELRMVVDALVIDSAELRVALASLYERSFVPLKRVGIETEWSMVNLPNVRWLSPYQILSILRILQEAITNAVQHGAPSKITIEGKICDATRFSIRVRNSGGYQFKINLSKHKHGLQNMSRRAKALGGDISISAIPGGAALVLTLPIYNDEHNLP